MRMLTLLAFVASVASQAAAQSTIFVVRHAERADAVPGSAIMMAADPELSAAGRARAEALAGLLKDADITAIYVTEFRRTQQTAAPLARAAGITPTPVPAKDTTALVQKLKTATGNILVVGHSNTVPKIIKALGVTTPVTVQDHEYDNLFIVTAGASPRVLQLHYR